MNPYDEKCECTNVDVYDFGPWMLQKRTSGENTFDVVKRDWVTIFHDHILEYVSNRDVVIQAGGWQGMYPFLLSNIFDRVYTFEPDPVNFHCLVNNCQRRNIFKFQAALGSECKIDTFEIVRGGQYATGQGRIKHHGSYDENFEIEEVQIQTLTIDSLSLNKCDLIMSDTEGWGLELLRGASDTIRKYSPVVILEKYHLEETTKKEIEFLNGFGYRCVFDGPNDLIFVVN